MNESFKTGASSHNPNVEEIAISISCAAAPWRSEALQKRGKVTFCLCFKIIFGPHNYTDTNFCNLFSVLPQILCAVLLSICKARAI